MIRSAFILVLALSCAPLAAAPISQETREMILVLADVFGVPRSVANQMHINETGDWKTGEWGRADAVRVEWTGWTSEGLMQLYTRPDNISWLLAMFWDHDPKTFDILDPIDNSIVALRYMRHLHDWLKNWYKAALFYNSGKLSGHSENTKAYARRIINAKEPR
jgi:hypothetical protein